MVRIIHSYRDLDIDGLSAVYSLDTAETFKQYREFCDYLREDFFTVPGAFYALLEADGGCLSAFRAEPYRDGYLIEGLQTRPDVRGRRYASQLLRLVLSGDAIPVVLPVYAHIHKKNTASLTVHRRCGFEMFMDHAVFIDGSVYHNSCTMILRR